MNTASNRLISALAALRDQMAREGTVHIHGTAGRFTDAAVSRLVRSGEWVVRHQESRDKYIMRWRNSAGGGTWVYGVPWVSYERSTV